MTDDDRVVRGLGHPDDPVVEVIDALRQPGLPDELERTEELAAAMAAKVSARTRRGSRHRWFERRRPTG